MKKLLSVLLSVMMILSTVSFAAPMAFTGADSAMDVYTEVASPEAELAQEGELFATVGDKSSYGTLVYSVDFERADFDVTAFSTAYAQISSNAITAYQNPDFPLNNTTTYTNAAGEGFSNAVLVKEGGNTYIQGDVAAGYDGFFRVSKYNQDWPDGYYILSFDIKAPVASGSSTQFNDTAIPVTHLRNFDPNNDDWQTVVVQTANVIDGNNATGGLYGFFFTPSNTTAGTVAYDNWEVYYRPATVTLTIEGNEYEVSTDAPVTVASLASKVTAPTGYILSGLSLTEGGELISDQYFFEDATLYPVFEKDPYMSETYGKALFVVDFENAAAQNWWGHSEYDNSTCSYGAQVWTVASYYDSRFNNANFRVRFVTNEGTHGNQGTVADAYGNHYNKGTTLVQWPNLTLSNWGNITGEPGIYTYVFKRMISGASSVSSSSPAGYTIVDGYCGEQGVWDTIVVQKQLDAAGNIPDGNIHNFSLAAADKGVAEVAYDDLYLYYKPFTADVTLIYNGEEYVAEDVSTAGVSADSILAAAGVEIPYGKKAVLSATEGGESVGNVITLAMDSLFYVSFVADDSISEYGKRLFLIDFENMTAGTSLTDFQTVDKYTDNYNGDWAHLSFNWEAGANAVVEEDGNKFIKGQQGWAQVRITNNNFESAPAGYYTMALKTKNFGDDAKYLSTKDQNSGTMATWVKAGSVTGTQASYPVVNGEWNEVASELNYGGKDFTIYYTAQMTTDIGFDDVALYYRPASVNLTIDDGGELTVYENCNSVVDVDALLADIKAPFGYKAALSTEKNGAPITGTLNLVSDAKLYVVLVEDETVHFEYGKALYIIDFERESMQGWNGNSQELDNSVKANGVQVHQSASYYDSMFAGKNYRVRFVINENDDWLFDQKTVEDANGNHYNTGTIKTQWPQVYQTNYGALTGKAGYYTFMVDSKTSAAPAGYGFGSWTKPEGFSVPVDEWFTIVGTQELTAEGTLPSGVWFNYNFGADQVGNVTVSFDNARMYYKPYTASVELVANGEVVAAKTDVSTAGVSVATLIDGIKVKGYAVEGVSFGGKTYTADETISIPCDCQIDLVLTEQAVDPDAPTTIEEKAIRTDDPTGIRFKASLDTIVDAEAFGWVVTTTARLEAAGVANEDFTFDTEVVKVSGWNYDINGLSGKVVSTAKIFDEEDSMKYFAGVLYYGTVEEDGVASVAKLTQLLVARPFTVVDGEYIYGEPIVGSIYDTAKVYADADYAGLSDAQKTRVKAIVDKVEA